MQQIFQFIIDNKHIGVNSEDGKSYFVSVDGAYAGIIFPSFDDNLSEGGILWKTNDLVAASLVKEIGKRIQEEDL